MIMKIKNVIVVIIVFAAVLVLIWFNRRDINSEIANQPAFENQSSRQLDDSWQEQDIDEIGLSFQMPKDTIFRKEVSEDGVVRKLVFYVQKGSDDNPDYMLYGLYQFQPDRQATKEVDIERWRAEMNPDTDKSATIDQYVGIEGFIEGTDPQYVSGRTRYVKVVLKDGGLLSVSTLPPTEENKELTEKILETFDFQ